jgi:hypothetical protein
VNHVRPLEALGTRDFDCLAGLLKQLCIGSEGKTVDEDALEALRRALEAMPIDYRVRKL